MINSLSLPVALILTTNVTQLLKSVEPKLIVRREAVAVALVNTPRQNNMNRKLLTFQEWIRLKTFCRLSLKC